MLACDLILEVRASRRLSGDQVRRLERMVFGAGQSCRDQLEMLLLLDAYVVRADPSWALLRGRAERALLDMEEALPVMPSRAA